MTASIIAAARELFGEFNKQRQFDLIDGEELQYWLKLARRVLEQADFARYPPEQLGRIFVPAARIRAITAYVSKNNRLGDSKKSKPQDVVAKALV